MELKNIETYASARHRFVLVVDGNERSLRFLSALLKEFRYEAYAVRTAGEALELATVISPVLVVIAGRLGAGNDAPDFIRKFRASNRACKAPFIVLLAGSDPAFERECLSAGALTCLHAPVSVENFYRIIQVAIEPVPRMTMRINTNLPATIGGKRADDLVRDLSENGAYVLTRSVRPLKTVLPVSIELSEGSISVDAEVIYAKKPEGDPNGRSGMGLQFVRISQEDQQRIRQFIRKEMSRSIGAGQPGR